MTRRRAAGQLLDRLTQVGRRVVDQLVGTVLLSRAPACRRSMPLQSLARPRPCPVRPRPTQRLRRHRARASVSPAFSCARSNSAWCDVAYVSVNEAAISSLTLSGIATACGAGVQTYSANPTDTDKGDNAIANFQGAYIRTDRVDRAGDFRAWHKRQLGLRLILLLHDQRIGKVHSRRSDANSRLARLQARTAAHRRAPALLGRPTRRTNCFHRGLHRQHCKPARRNSPDALSYPAQYAIRLCGEGPAAA